MSLKPKPLNKIPRYPLGTLAAFRSIDPIHKSQKIVGLIVGTWRWNTKVLDGLDVTARMTAETRITSMGNDPTKMSPDDDESGYMLLPSYPGLPIHYSWFADVLNGHLDVICTP